MAFLSHTDHAPASNALASGSGLLARIKGWFTEPSKKDAPALDTDHLSSHERKDLGLDAPVARVSAFGIDYNI